MPGSRHPTTLVALSLARSALAAPTLPHLGELRRFRALEPDAGEPGPDPVSRMLATSHLMMYALHDYVTPCNRDLGKD